jgi:hypothetical protein
MIKKRNKKKLLKGLKMKLVDKETFELMFELEEIEEVEEIGYMNTYDISVTGNETFLLESGIVSHNSAKNGLLPGLGREGIAYYELKGKPMNVYEVTHQKFTSNKELTELYQIIKNEGFEVTSNSSLRSFFTLSTASSSLAFTFSSDSTFGESLALAYLAGTGLPCDSKNCCCCWSREDRPPTCSALCDSWTPRAWV